MLSDVNNWHAQDAHSRWGCEVERDQRIGEQFWYLCICVYVFVYLCMCVFVHLIFVWESLKNWWASNFSTKIFVCLYLCIWCFCEIFQRIDEESIFQILFCELWKNPFEFYFTSISVLFEMSRLININSGPMQKIFQRILFKGNLQILDT